MNILDIIEKKKIAEELSKEEIDFFIKGYTSGEIPDYQAAALIMAICINGMTQDEILFLTDSMAKSGEILDLTGFTVNSCDKRAYELIGVSSYNKKAGVNNNYITHCKNIKGDKNWYEFNVTSISRAQFKDINENFPYLLIYKRASLQFI